MIWRNEIKRGARRLITHQDLKDQNYSETLTRVPDCPQKKQSIDQNNTKPNKKLDVILAFLADILSKIGSILIK